jgi:hypothetical protein
MKKAVNKPVRNFQGFAKSSGTMFQKKKYYIKDLKKPPGSQGSSNRNNYQPKVFKVKSDS